jgi:hypothetical protein
MDTNLLFLGIIAFAGYLLYKFFHRLFNRPNREFWKYYREVLNSSKYKVKGHFED